VSTSTVYHIEASKVRPRPAIVRRLARALDVSPGDIDVDEYRAATAHGDGARTS